MVVKRNGEIVNFDKERIGNALQKATRASDQKLSRTIYDELINNISKEINTRFVDFYPNVENIQDIVEKHLVKLGLYEISKTYILYRAKRQAARENQKEQNLQKSLLGKLKVKKKDGRVVLFSIENIKEGLRRASKDYASDISIDLLAKEVVKNIYDGVTTDEIEKAMILSTVSFIEKDPAYNRVGGQMFLQKLYKEIFKKSITEEEFETRYRNSFISNIKKGVEAGVLNPKMAEFDLEKLSFNLQLEKDRRFNYQSIQTLYERYFFRIGETRMETPQSFWMRVAMGLAINEPDKNEKATLFYELISSLRFVPSTPTLFHSGLMRSQLSSCFLTTVEDDLHHIFKCIGDNAQLSKYSGGVANDWTNIRSTGSIISSINVESQGVIPFLKIANDTTVAINRSGKRRGATVAYLETWHLDYEDFLDLRKNTGDDRRRTHDMNTASWIPDLFMKRVMNDENWTLFSSEEVSDLHHIYGREFEKKYVQYEEMVENGEIKKHKTVSAKKLWKKMLTSLFETGHPWITFKDPSNIRSPQDHVGVVHSSNLCTEITLNTSAEETAVCNLGSVNLSRHVVEGTLDKELLAETVRTAMRMLDNVIDLNFYPTKECETSNFKHRPVGMGVMGFQDALFKLNMPFDSPSAVKFSDTSMEYISYHAIMASSELAKEKGAYGSFQGSKWDRGIFPVDTLKLLEEERGISLEVNKDEKLDWTPVREHVKQHGMRNSNSMAIAPTATISTIAGCFPCIEPIYKNIYVKANITGEFTVVNEYLVKDLKKHKLWNDEMLDQIKYHDGNIQNIPGIPQEIKDKYKEAFEIDPELLVAMTAARGKWIDQSQSHNVFMKGTSGNKLNDVYFRAWNSGLKTTYYLRSLASTQVEKSTLDAKQYGYTQKRKYEDEEKKEPVEEKPIEKKVMAGEAPAPTCRIDDPDCEACQ